MAPPEQLTGFIDAVATCAPDPNRVRWGGETENTHDAAASTPAGESANANPPDLPSHADRPINETCLAHTGFIGRQPLPATGVSRSPTPMEATASMMVHAPMNRIIARPIALGAVRSYIES